MGNSKLVRTLATLSKDEWSSLRKYILMSHDKTTEAFKIFSEFQKRKEKLNSPFDTSALHKKYFGKLTSKGFSNLLSRINKTIEDWLAIQQFENQNYARELSLVKAYNSRGLYQHADRIATKLEKQIAVDTTLDLAKTDIIHQLLHTQYYSDNPIKYNLTNNLLKELVITHKQYYHQLSLQYIAEMINWGAIKNLDFKSELDQLDNILPQFESDELTKELGIMIKLVKNKDLDSLYWLTNSLLQGKFSIDSEIHDLVTLYLISFSLKIWMKGELSNPDKLVELYEYGLSSGALLRSGKIPQTRFYNILSTIGAIKDYYWTDGFVDRWIIKVDAINIDSAVALSKAYNNFYHQKYEEMRALLSKVKFEFTEQKLRSLGLILIAQYKDSSSHDLLPDQIDNFRRTLKRNKHRYSHIFLESHLNLIEVIEWMYSKKYKQVQLNLDKYKYLIYRQWCMEEINYSKAH